MACTNLLAMLGKRKISRKVKRLKGSASLPLRILTIMTSEIIMRFSALLQIFCRRSEWTL